jgi:hypothetical protein
LAEQLGALHGKPVTVLPNGFDDADFLIDETLEEFHGFTIVYTGTIYPGKQDPSPLFEALCILRTRAPDVAQDIELHFFGAAPDLLADLAARWQVADQLKVHPRVANREAMHWQQKADMLVLLEWNDPTAKGVYTGKVFEYLGARRPILATGPSGGVIEALLRETESGGLVNDAEGAARMIEQWWRGKRLTGSTRLPAREARLRPYTRRYQAGVLAGVLRSAVRDAAVRP